MRTARVYLACAWGAALALSAPRARAEPPSAPALYYERPISPADLRGKGLRELEILRATIHARAGLVFFERWLRDYFAHSPWYRPGGYDPARLTPVDQQNLKTIARYGASITKAELQRRWDSLVGQHGHAVDPSRSRRVIFSQDGSVVISALFSLGPQPPVSLFRAATGARLGKVAWAGGSQFQDLRLVGQELAVMSDYDVRVGEWRRAAPRLTLTVGAKPRPDGHRDPPPRWGCISPNARSIVVEVDGQAASFNLSTRKRDPLLSLERGPIISAGCTFIDTQRTFVKGHQLAAGHLLDVRTQTLTPLAVPAGNSVISPDGRLLARWDRALDGSAGAVEVWNLQGTPRRVQLLAGSEGTLLAAFSPDATRLLTSDASGRLIHWNTSSGARAVWRDVSLWRWFDATSLAEDSLEAGEGADLLEDAPSATRETRYDVVTGLAFSPDGARALVAYSRGQLELRDAHTGTLIDAFRGHAPWSDEALWEIQLLAQRLGRGLETSWPRVPEFVDPLRHLAALEGRMPERLLRRASRAQLRMLRNAIMARRGASFDSPVLRDLFAGASWYVPAPDYTINRLNPIDQENVVRIRRRERALGGPIGDAGLRATLGGSAGVEHPF